jgi:5-formyltetrahydrofolate cyclo-ligase
MRSFRDTSKNMDKAQLRQQIKGTIAQTSPEARAEMSRAACRHLLELDEYKRAAVVMCFLSLPHEIDTTPIILHAWQHDKTVAVPKISWQQRHMIAVEISSLETGITTGSSGLKNPTTGVPMPLEEIDLIITPGIAFAEDGNRLGRGAGYYDRFFNSKDLKAVRCAIAFGAQVVDTVPTDEHDQPIDLIVTENGVINCKKQ